MRASDFLKIKIVLSALVLSSALWGLRQGPCEAAQASAGVNVQVDSTDLEPYSIDKKTDPEERAVFFKDENAALEINEDGDPSLNMRF